MSSSITISPELSIRHDLFGHSVLQSEKGLIGLDYGMHIGDLYWISQLCHNLQVLKQTC